MRKENSSKKRKFIKFERNITSFRNLSAIPYTSLLIWLGGRVYLTDNRIALLIETLIIAVSRDRGPHASIRDIRSLIEFREISISLVPHKMR